MTSSLFLSRSHSGHTFRYYFCGLQSSQSEHLHSCINWYYFVPACVFVLGCVSTFHLFIFLDCFPSSVHQSIPAAVRILLRTLTQTVSNTPMWKCIFAAIKDKMPPYATSFTSFYSAVPDKRPPRFYFPALKWKYRNLLFLSRFWSTLFRLAVKKSLFLKFLSHSFHLMNAMAVSQHVQLYA